MSRQVLLLAAAALAGGLLATAPASAGTWVKGPYYGPNGGRAGAVVRVNPYNGNRAIAWGAQGPQGNWAAGAGRVYHGPCRTWWSGAVRGPNGGVIAGRGVRPNGTC